MRKRLLWLAMSLTILISIFFGGAASAAESDGTIRVKLSMGSQTSISFFIDGNYSVSGDDDTALERQLYTMKLKGDTLRLYFGSKLLYSGSTITLIQHAPTAGLNNFIWINNQRYGYAGYLGDFIFTIDDGHIVVINRLYLEDYLYGVLPYEMSNSWPAEALKSQAVAARSYAYSFMGKSGSYDVVDTSASQVYKGYNAAYTNVINAVDATAKKVAAYNGKPICTYFSASNGGWTEIPLHVWRGGTDLPYYQIVKDSFDKANPSSLYETVFFPIAIDGEHPVTVSGNVGDTPNAENAVTYLRYAIAKSHVLADIGVDSVSDFELTGVTGLTAHTPDTDGAYNDRVSAYSSIECTDYIKATGSFTVIVDGVPTTAEDVTLDLRYFDASNGIETYKVFNKDSLRLFVVEPVSSGETVIGYSISQKRYGHGIGLSQRGAQQRAKKGKDYREIISFYYPGTSLLKLPIAAPKLTSIDTASSADATVVNTKSLNVRSGPSTSYKVLGTLPRGARINVTRRPAGWCEIKYGGTYAYVHADYVDFDYDYTDNISGGKLYRTFYNSDGSVKREEIYYGADSFSGIQKINYYSDGVRTSYKLYDKSGRLKNLIALYNNGNIKKVNYYNTSIGNRYAYKLYDTAGRMTHYTYTYADGVKPKKTSYYNVSTGKRYAYKLYDTAGRTTHYIFTYNDGNKPKKTNYYNVNNGIRKYYKLYDAQGRATHYAECYSDGVKAKKMNYYNPATGVRTAYKTYRTDGSCSCWVQCNSSGQPYKATYYDKDGDVIKVVYY